MAQLGKNWFRKSTTRSTPRKRRLQRSRLGLEMLEDRRVFATFTVMNGADSGPGSLREAAALANADVAADTIQFAPTVTAVTLTSDQISIASDTKITGPAGGTVTIARSSAPSTPDFRIFETGVGANVEFHNLTISGGRGANGGGIRGGGPIIVSSSNFIGNSATADGGAIWGRVTLTSSTIKGNSAGGHGGGIYHLAGTTEITDSTVSDNLAGGNGGGIYVFLNDVIVSSSSMSNNSANGFSGGAIYMNSSTNNVTVQSSTLTDNTALNGVGGGIASPFGGDITVTLSTLSGNQSQAGGGIYKFDGFLSVNWSTFSDNSGTFGGGGLMTLMGATRVYNSTISGNTTQFDGGGMSSSGNVEVASSTFSGNSADAYGGGIYHNGGTLSVYSSTLSHNSASNAGGVYNGTTAHLSNTIVANSIGADLEAEPSADYTGFNNLVEDGSGGAGLGKISGDPLLGPLANNGGPTLTHNLLPGSPAINAGNNGLAAYPVDQRGFQRIVGGVVDIGSVEHQGGIAFLQQDPLNPGQNALVVVGSAGSDLIGVDRHGHNYKVGILSFTSSSWVPSVWTGTFDGPISRVIVYGEAGSDIIAVDNNLKADAWLYGGAGNDVMIGGGGNDLLLGGDGNDKLTARGGRDILIGGADADVLFAGNSEDLLIAGSTAFDLNEEALNSIQREWTSDRKFENRVKNLRGTGTGPRENGSFFLKASGLGATVFSDSSRDELKGGSGRDWYFANLAGSGVRDDLDGLKKNDLVDEL